MTFEGPFSDISRLRTSIRLEACLDIHDGSFLFLCSYDLYLIRFSQSRSNPKLKGLYAARNHGRVGDSWTLGRSPREKCRR